MKKIKATKGEILQSAADLNSKVYFVESGLLRSYSIDANGKEHIFMFAPENWLIGDGVSIDEPCQLYIDVLEDSVITPIEKNDPIIMDSNKLLIKRVSVLQNRIIKLMSATAIERYEDFTITYPDIVQRVPQKMIASYLGITPEALSTVKRNRLKK
ncbi:Crp/Fnr family transcriptional regulator [Flavobacterium frigidarium]|mgnify:CR=1 FL=1|uniref:Crp/Fnr family transcriptional regulator n=1 Tax=Flavobacterium frigidarium TaxID=99286 RepID=UPI0030D87BDE